MKIKAVVAIIVVVLVGVYLAKVLFFPAPRGWQSITPAALEERLENGDKLIIVDLREKELYDRGHVPGAILIPFSSFRQRITDLNPQDTIVFVCHMGPMGEASAQLLVQNGFKSVYNLVGGMGAWQGKTETSIP
ncbi:MAG: rhodanese-like domain-containing protein [Bacillota bacterium]